MSKNTAKHITYICFRTLDINIKVWCISGTAHFWYIRRITWSEWKYFSSKTLHMNNTKLSVKNYENTAWVQKQWLTFCKVVPINSFEKWMIFKVCNAMLAKSLCSSTDQSVEKPIKYLWLNMWLAQAVN